MPEDIPPIVTTEITEPVEEVTLEQIREQLLARLDALDARIAELERRIAEHGHDGYASGDHNHETRTKEADKEPQANHWYFRKVGD